MPKQRMLLFAGSAADRSALRALFQPENEWNILEAETGPELLALARRHGFAIDLCVVDAALLVGEGLDAALALQTGESVDCPPLVLLLPRGMSVDAALPPGLYVCDTLETPIQPRIGWRRLRCLIELHEYQKRDILYQHVLSRDPLLGLPSGASLESAMGEGLAALSGRAMLLHINVDGLKAINERCGNHFGDLVLVDTAEALSREMPPSAIIGRPHGDTFCALVPRGDDRLATIRFAEGLKAALRHEYPDAPGAPVVATVCVGVSCAPEDGAEASALYEAAEIATSVAKRMGKDNLVFYNASMRWAQRTRASSVSALGSGPLPGAPVGRFLPMLTSEGRATYGYDYYAYPAESGDEGMSARAMESVMSMPGKAAAHLLRISMRQLFSFLYSLTTEGIRLPLIGLYIALRAEDADALPRTLHEALAQHPVDPSRLCVNIAQDMALNMDRTRLEAFVGELRALGFQVGIHSVGEPSIANVCLGSDLFDRVVLAERFARDLLGGVYPPQMTETLLPALAHGRAAICLPVDLSSASLSAAANALHGAFCCYGGPALGMEAFRAHSKAQGTPHEPPETARRTISFRIGADQYNDIFEKSGIVLLDWRPHDNMILFSESFETVHSLPVDDLRAEDGLLQRTMHPDDYPRFWDAMMLVKHGQSQAEGVMRMPRMADGEAFYRWRRYSLIALPDEGGVVRRVFGISFDIDRERRELQDYQQRAETDPLTQLYNRGATEQHIARFLRDEGGGGEHALMMLDIDDFKALNDTFGHTGGDEALQYIAGQLRALFRAGDIVGRVGGDEFMVFLKNIRDEAMIAARAEAICALLRRANPAWNLSGTVGVARYPRDGQSFQALYARADEALYRAKAAGKNQWGVSGGESTQEM